MEFGPYQRSPSRIPEREAEKLKRQFKSVSSRFFRSQRRRRMVHKLQGIVFPGVVVIAAVSGVLLASPWPPPDTIRHLAAFPSCEAAHFVRVAPAARGAPGYYLRHDDDRDGLACEEAGRR